MSEQTTRKESTFQRAFWEVLLEDYPHTTVELYRNIENLEVNLLVSEDFETCTVVPAGDCYPVFDFYKGDTAYEKGKRLCERMGWREVRRHHIIVGNIGTVCSTNSYKEAQSEFDYYSELSATGYGRASGEPVTWMQDGDLLREKHGESPAFFDDEFPNPEDFETNSIDANEELPF